MHPDLPLSRDKFHPSLEKSKRLRERHQSSFCSTTLCASLLAYVDRHALKKWTLRPLVCLLSSPVMGGFIIAALNPCPLYKSRLFFTMKELCVTSCLVPFCGSSSANISNQALLMNEFSADDLVPQCHGDVWLCPDRGASPESVWSSVQRVRICITFWTRDT